MDLAGRVAPLTGASMFTLAPLDGVELRFSDGPTGVRGLRFHGGPVVALLPNATLLASAWREDTMYEVGTILAGEAARLGVHVVLGPTINLHRTPLGGRLFEAFSEDPLLTGKLAAGYVRGLQEHGVGACLKHLVANESETDRNTVDSVVDEATLREVYLLPFEIAVDEADPWTMMAAYNDVNGVAATEQDHVNNGIVKGEWGYRGLIMSDWFATKTTVRSANGGLDLVMPGPGGPWGPALVEAVRAGLVAGSTVDDHLDRLRRLARRVSPDAAAGPAPDDAGRRQQLVRLAARGMTVLTNNGVLPLARDRSVALIGRHAVSTVCMGGGSAQVNPPYQVSVAVGLGAEFPTMTVVDGVPVRQRPVTPFGAVFDPDPHRPGVRVTLRDAAGAVIEERHSSDATAVVGLDDDLGTPVASVTFRGRLTAGGAVELGATGVGDWHLSAGPVDERFTLSTSGRGFGEAIIAPPFHTVVAEVAGGTTVEATVTLPAPDEGPMGGAGRFGLVVGPAPRPLDDVLADAVSAARRADVAVVVVGLTEEQETEAVDKSTLRLPGDQDALVSAVAAAARRTVVVVNAATPVLMPWLDDVDAVLWAGLPGQEGGNAVAAALLGVVEPAGRLVTTFPAADGASPAWSVTPVDGKLEYTEGPFVGYRGHHAGRAPAPLFWFGHGLGYGSWEYGDVSVSTDPLTVSVSVSNTSTQTSREVVQVYLEPVEDDQPVRLVGWSSVEVVPGGTAPVVIEPDARMWRRWDAAAGRWDRLKPGGHLLVARGLGDVVSRTPLPD
ncbi:glycoside hydrolase family 3 C-terminal domain-containing protein [Virgisporangium ochraceum]|uniref:Beta-glucosidase n=1 Tax=Virgisporangium ochraceum TaxID=65505 RepID=A0A8J3ZY81_9ACTN|nr:glycoside hydrolase family 3 C-terminal domain-containing protein [Virgisporangium ochraceum]GIJ72287.1 beta-glucosidase [Virgisporangium ochraceum]